MRALAVALVVFAHGSGFLDAWLDPDSAWADYAAGPAAGVGVNLFFCLSGFLIGSIVLDMEQGRNGSAAIGTFMIRRWMRTLPLYFFLLAVLLLAPALDPSHRQRVWSYVILSQNLLTPFPAGGWFGPTWSLVIEEWSYLIFPLIAFGLFRRLPHSVALTAVLLIVCGFTIRYLRLDLNADWDTTVRKFAPARVDAIAYGVLTAWLFRLWKDRLILWLTILAPASLMLLGYSLWVININGTYGRIFELPLIAVALCALMPLTMALRLPGWAAKPIRYTAAISYSIYLVHWSVLFLVEPLPTGWKFPVFITVTLVASSVTYRVIEQPFMKLRPRAKRTPRIGTSGIATPPGIVTVPP